MAQTRKGGGKGKTHRASRSHKPSMFEAGRRQGLEEGRRQGLEEGRRQGLEEGRQQGLEEGRRQGLEKESRAAIELNRQETKARIANYEETKTAREIAQRIIRERESGAYSYVRGVSAVNGRDIRQATGPQLALSLAQGRHCNIICPICKSLMEPIKLKKVNRIKNGEPEFLDEEVNFGGEKVKMAVTDGGNLKELYDLIEVDVKEYVEPGTKVIHGCRCTNHKDHFFYNYTGIFGRDSAYEFSSEEMKRAYLTNYVPATISVTGQRPTAVTAPITVPAQLFSKRSGFMGFQSDPRVKQIAKIACGIAELPGGAAKTAYKSLKEKCTIS